MKIRFRILHVLALTALAATWGACASSARRPESELIRALDSPKESTVCDALQALEKEYPASLAAQSAIIAKLDDPRNEVHRKAARVLGVIGVRLDDQQTAKIVILLTSRDVDTVIDGLKALRGTGNTSAVPAIVPLVKHPDSHVKRDACRTLAVLGDKSLVPAIEPLQNDRDHEVAEDARMAIARLQEK